MPPLRGGRVVNVDDVVRERIEAARRKAEQEKQRRAELAEARRHGLAKRHAAKLRAVPRMRPVSDQLAAPGTVREVVAYAIDDWLESTAPTGNSGAAWSSVDIAEHVVLQLEASGYRIAGPGTAS